MMQEGPFQREFSRHQGGFAAPWGVGDSFLAIVEQVLSRFVL